MSTEDIKLVVNHAINDNAADMKDALYNAINDKIFAAIEQRKIAVASGMLAQKETQNSDSEEIE